MSLLANTTLLSMALLPSTQVLAQETTAPVELRLIGPSDSPVVWGATEWAVEVLNVGLDALAVSPRAFSVDGCAGSLLYLEVVRDGEGVLRADGNTYQVQALEPRSGRVLSRGEMDTIPVVAHGKMSLNLAGKTREEVYPAKFQPTFSIPGTYRVTAVWQMGAERYRSAPVEVSVRDCPVDWQPALNRLKGLVQDGVCVDVRGIYTTGDWADFERIAEFVEEESHTLYGSQMRIGLARAFINYSRFLRSNSSGDEERKGKADLYLDRVVRLLDYECVAGFGLGAAQGRMRAAVAADEARLKR